MKVEIRIPSSELEITITAPEAGNVLEIAAMLLLKMAGRDISSLIKSEKDANAMKPKLKPQNS
jgi:hypothetical protein